MVKVKRVPGRKLKPPQAEKKFCAFLHRHCTRPRIDGYMFCMAHILEDKTAPFRQCTFTHPSSRRRCINAAPKNERYESLCPWHSKQARAPEAPKHISKSEPESLISLMSQLEHYCEDRRHNRSYDPDDDSSRNYAFMSDFGDSQDLDHIGSGSHPGQKTRVCDTRMGHSDVSESGTDCSDDDEPLKHAGVYTYEEVARIYRDKLIKLQTLYIEETKFLQYLLCEKRRDYLRALKNEKRTQGSISNTMPQTTLEEKEKYKMFRAMIRYHRVFGQEALLREKSLKKRLELSGGPFPPNLFPKDIPMCIFVGEENCLCRKMALPLTKYCMDHILSDSRQVLFQPCPGGNGSCTKVVVPYTEDSRCLLHSCPEPPPLHGRESTSPVAGPSGLQNITDNQEQEHFQSMDDIASLGLDAVIPGSLFGLNQYGELDDESTDSCPSYDSRQEGYLYNESSEYPDELLSDARADST